MAEAGVGLAGGLVLWAGRGGVPRSAHGFGIAASGGEGEGQIAWRGASETEGASFGACDVGSAMHARGARPGLKIKPHVWFFRPYVWVFKTYVWFF